MLLPAPYGRSAAKMIRSKEKYVMRQTLALSNVLRWSLPEKSQKLSNVNMLCHFY